MTPQELQNDPRRERAAERRDIAKPGSKPETTATANDEHMGAKEDQVSPTTPPRSDDDEPKQG